MMVLHIGWSTLLLLIGFCNEATSMDCTKEILGITSRISCPAALDHSDNSYCCGSEESRYCCNFEEYMSSKDFVGIVAGVLTSVLVVAVIIVVLSCFCCSCCLLAKRRQRRGRVLYGPVTVTTTTAYPVAYPQQQYPQHPYPPQQFAPQQAYPCSQPYPTMGVAPLPENPPLYPGSDQPAFNPGYPGK